MSFFDFFRNFLGTKRRNEPGTSGLGNDDSYRDSFRNPIWQSDEDEDDIDDFRHPRSGIHFSIFSEPLEMTRYFESQMDNMLKNFFFGFNNGFFGDEIIKELPFAPEKNDNLRDKVLKSYPDASVTDISPKQKIDTDLDGKITAEEFSRMWNKGNVETVKPFVPHSFSTGRSVRKEIIRRSDGTIEQKQIIRDSEGNEKTIVSREIGDKKYVITTKKDKNGVETKSEDLFNMDESELKDFTRKWTPSINDNIDSHDTTLNRFPWEKFFGPNPKL
ncbi:HCLS1-associated protein X-1 [Polyergus mexicanus]|uniref:HCLS1-associated protein X-1 n=1 Tax=Polyergus mexicanus TaxID=615972 RepID=UPI0038B61742